MAGAALLAAPASAQFTGPEAAGRELTAAAAQEARAGTYVVAHLREDDYRFRDDSGELRVEIDDALWGGREVSPEDAVRLSGEIDRTNAGVTYVWIKSLALVE